MTDKIQVFLTSAQKSKFEKGKTFQLSATQLNAGTGKFHVEIEMTTKNHKELLRNVARNKGYRFTREKVVGGSIFGKVLKTVAKAVAPKALDFVGEKTGTKSITDALKPSANGLIDVGVDKITGGKLKKGSPEMAEKMARLRSMRKRKQVDGGNIFDDIKNGWNRTFNPKLGREIKKALTSGEAKDIYKGIADVGLTAVAGYTGSPMLGAVGSQLVNSAIDGAGVRRKYGKKNTLVVGGNLVSGIPQVQIRGKGFIGEKGTKFGGSFKSPTGGSMMSP
jgi:hypothetical protein